MKSSLMTRRESITPAPRLAREEDGMALLLVLLFIVLLTVIVTEYSYESVVDATIISGHMNDLQAYVAAKSAVAEGISSIVFDVTDPEAQGTAPYDSYLDAWALMAQSVRPMNEAVYLCTITDEFGKLPLNALFLQNPSEQDQADNAQLGLQVPNEALVTVLRKFFELRGVEEDPVDAILDWMDVDDEDNGSGTESGFYESLDSPYRCKNGPLDSVEELLLIAGITPEIYFGDMEQGQLPLTELLTVNGNPTGKVNINTAELEVLAAYGEALGIATLVDEYEKVRETPYTSAEELASQGFIPDQKDRRNAAPPQTPLAGQDGEEQLMTQPMLDVASNVFRVQGDGIIQDAIVRVEAYVYRGAAVGAGGYRLLSWRVIR